MKKNFFGTVKNKAYRFHQFIHLEKGPMNTAIIDFLKGDIYQVENQIIEKFKNEEYNSIIDFIYSAEKEGLIINVDRNIWIPYFSFDVSSQTEIGLSFELQVEEGVDLKYIKSKFNDFEIIKILFYGKVRHQKLFPKIKITEKRKNFNRCVKLSKVDKNFPKITESFFRFNMKYNSCWGKNIAITKDNKIKPCIFSEIVIGDLEKDNIYDMIEKIKGYWFITKDKVKKCKDCELRYVCFDCREIPLRMTGDLYAPNPNCKYNPYTGVWFEERF